MILCADCDCVFAPDISTGDPGVKVSARFSFFRPLFRYIPALPLSLLGFLSRCGICLDTFV